MYASWKSGKFSQTGYIKIIPNNVNVRSLLDCFSESSFIEYLVEKNKLELFKQLMFCPFMYACE